MRNKHDYIKVNMLVYKHRRGRMGKVTDKDMGTLLDKFIDIVESMGMYTGGGMSFQDDPKKKRRKA